MSNKFLQAKEVLTKIYLCENEIFYSENSNREEKNSKSHAVLPINLDPIKVKELKELKNLFKGLLKELLNKRSEFFDDFNSKDNDKFFRNDLVTEEDDEDITAYVKTSLNEKPPSFSLKAELKKPYYILLITIIFISVVAFLVMTCIATSYYYSKYIGPWIVVSRSSASAIFTTCALLMIFVSYDVLTLIRSKCKGKCLLWLDNNILIHRICGFVVVFYGTLHTIGHCLGSIKKISEETDISKANEATLHHDFPHTVSYADLFFFSIPGSTGIILTIQMFLMMFTSLRCFRRRWYQVFSYIHVINYPIFLILLIVHGCGTWFNWGFPLGSIFVTPTLILICIQWYIKIKTIRRFKFKIADVSISENRKYIMIYFIRPEGYSVNHGQYMFVNIPSISCTQWHPFTAASVPDSKFIVLMIKRAGDWTGKLIDTLFEQK